MALPVTGDWAICQNPEAGANAVCSQRCLSSWRNETLGEVRNTLDNTKQTHHLKTFDEEESYRKLFARLSVSIEWKSTLLEHLEHHQCLCPTWTTAPSVARSVWETEMTRVTFKTQDFRTFLSLGRLLRNDWEILCQFTLLWILHRISSSPHFSSSSKLNLKHGFLLYHSSLFPTSAYRHQRFLALQEVLLFGPFGSMTMKFLRCGQHDDTV